jgi:hypothetical protein
MNRILAGLAIAGVAACAGPVTVETAPAMATTYLCELLDPDLYLLMDGERRVVHSELERRGEECPRRERRAPAPVVYVPNFQPAPMPYFPTNRTFEPPRPLFQTTQCNPTFGGGVMCTTF